MEPLMEEMNQEITEPKFEEDALTYGMKAVGLSFNPSGNENVNYVKSLCAKVIDLLNDLRADQRNEQSRLLSVAITEMQTAQMWAVKGITWKD